MTYFYTKELLICFGVYLTYAQLKTWLKWRAHGKWSQENGCVDPPKVKNYLPWGMERLYFMIQGLIKGGLDFLEDMLRARFKSMHCGTYRVRGLFNSSIIFTADPRNVQAVLATKFQDFDLGPLRSDNFMDMLGKGIFTAEREAWQHYRLQLKPQFTRDQVSDLETADHHMDILFSALPSENSEGWTETTDLLPLLYAFTLDTSTEFLFGESVNSQTYALPSFAKTTNPLILKEREENLAFSQAMTFGQEYIAWRMRLRGLWYLANSKKFQDACKTLKDYADKFVRAALDPNRKPPSSDKFILLNALAAENKDPVELRSQVIQILLAGRDTTASLLSWTLLLLARHPSEFLKLRTSIISHFGTASKPTQELTFSSLKSCKEITHVLYEVLRLYPLVPVNARIANKNTILPVGGGKNKDQPIAVMKGEQVFYSAYVMQRRGDLFGGREDEFWPERWEGRKLGWEMIPFSGGPRLCLGQQYALNEASFVLVKFLQRFDKMEALDMVGPLKKALTITLSPGDGVKVKLRRAKD